MAEKSKKKKSDTTKLVNLDSPDIFFNRELSWLQFARRVLAQVADPELPLLERVKFAGIMGMLHDEFFMKRVGGIKRQLRKGAEKLSIDGRTPLQELMECRAEVLDQLNTFSKVLSEDVMPNLAVAGIPILSYSELTEDQRKDVRKYFVRSVLPILTPLAVDAEHPFPFISNLGLNLAAEIRDTKKARKRIVRIKVPDNRQRWVRLEDRSGYVPLEQVIANNLDELFPDVAQLKCYVFRVTRGAEADREEVKDLGLLEMPQNPGSIIREVTGSLKARRFAGVVRLQVENDCPEKLISWLCEQLGITDEDVYQSSPLMGVNDLLKFRPESHPLLGDVIHEPVAHPRLATLDAADTNAIFKEIKRRDLLLHHPYHDFDTSVLHFLRCAAIDPKVLGIKLTIYRTSADSPIIQALVEASRRGKQVSVLVEITARFDEAPNIAWGKLLEEEGVHVAYGVEKLKTHVKLALVVREEQDGITRYVHAGTGNYHSGTARIYEDFGLLTCDPELGQDAAAVFNELTGAAGAMGLKKLLVAPDTMRDRFIEMIEREIEHCVAKRPCGIRAKMNQLQDPDMIRALYRASQTGVPIELNVRGLCCLRPGVPGLSETIQVFGLIGRFLEHSRLYRFENGGEPEYYIGSADWMRRNLSNRVETISPVADAQACAELDQALAVYAADNCSAWDCQPDGSYLRRQPAAGEPRRSAQEVFITLAQPAPFSEPEEG